LAQESAKPSTAPAVKIRHNYIPAAQARNSSTAGKSICPNCHQLIANDEMEQHMRIEMLNPDWRDQYRISQERSSMTNLSTADVAANLKRLASQRSDVFEEEARKRVEVGDARGQPAPVPVPVVQPAAGAGDGTGEGKDVQEQIRLIHERARKGG
jgi:splicing factor 3A subunit 1